MQNKKECNNLNYIYECPILNTHDKLEEAHYFFHMMMNSYHIADVFRYNLNAFIQSLRHTTFILQTEKKKMTLGSSIDPFADSETILDRVKSSK